MAAEGPGKTRPDAPQVEPHRRRSRGVPRDVVIVLLIWIVLTAIFEWLATMDYLPVKAAREAEISDSTFRTLTFMGIPVVTFVFSVLGYSVFAFRTRSGGPPDGDGPGFKTAKRVPWIWLVLTSGLAITTVIYPGLTELREFRGSSADELVVNVVGVQWAWMISYPEEGVDRSSEIVLPKGKRVRFDVSAEAGAADAVVHSFWVPAFRAKIDAVPGMVTSIRVTATETGCYQQTEQTGPCEENTLFRMQCAELCGRDHGKMFTPVRVVEPDEFDEWLEAQKA